MKKSKKILLWTILFVGLVLLAGCSKKAAMTEEEFTEKMEEMGFTVTKSERPEWTTYRAVGDSGMVLVSFRICENTEVAKDYYDRMLLQDTRYYDEIDEESSTSFMAVGNRQRIKNVRVENTLLFIEGTETYLDEFEEMVEMFEEIGY